MTNSFAVVTPPSKASIHAGGVINTISHRIPHRLVAANTFSTMACGVCHRFMWGLRKHAMKCKGLYLVNTSDTIVAIDCGYPCHAKCASSAPQTCGLSMEMLAHAIAFASMIKQ